MSNDRQQYINKLVAELERAEAEKKAIIAEFLSSVPEEWTADDIKKKLRNDLLPTAWARLTSVLKTTENETLAANVAWKVIQLAIGSVQITDVNDPNKSELTELLKKLDPATTNDAETAERE